MWGEENEKKTEILTVDIIKKELKKSCVLGMALSLILAGLFALAFWLFYIILMHDGYEPWVFYTVFGILALIVFCVIGYDMFFKLRVFILISKDEFTLSLEELKSAEERIVTRRRSFQTLYDLNFAGYDRYTIPAKNYKWSKMFCMSDYGVFNYSVEGDMFYVVAIGKHILSVYNTKIFEMPENALHS